MAGRSEKAPLGKEHSVTKAEKLKIKTQVGITLMVKVEDFLKSQGIEYTFHQHPAVYTSKEAEKYCGEIPGLSCKNLLLQNREGKRYFLVVLPATKRLNLKQFGETINESKIIFASSEALQEKLGTEAGAVSPFGLLNDKKNEVEVYLDSDVYNADRVNFHPNRNTASLELSKEMFHKFLQVIEQQTKVINF